MTDAEEGRTEDVQDPIPGRVDVALKLAVFQFKLFADGVRDVIWSPLSLIAGIAGILGGGDRPDRYLQEVMRAGRRTDEWINLFGAYDEDGTADELLEPLQSAARETITQHAQRADRYRRTRSDPGEPARSEARTPPP